MDIKGDPSKQPPECGKFIKYDEDNPRPANDPWPNSTGYYPRCPNLKDAGDSWDGETYECDTCGAYYKLYYEDMA